MTHRFKAEDVVLEFRSTMMSNKVYQVVNVSNAFRWQLNKRLPYAVIVKDTGAVCCGASEKDLVYYRAKAAQTAVWQLALPLEAATPDLELSGR